MAMLILLGVLLLQTGTDEPADAAGWKQRGLKFASSHQVAAAAGALGKACQLAPADEDACYYLGRTLFALGRYLEAQKPFDAALRAAPKTSRAKVHRAIALNYVALTSPEEAERHFREAIRLGPQE